MQQTGRCFQSRLSCIFVFFPNQSVVCVSASSRFVHRSTGPNLILPNQFSPLCHYLTCLGAFIIASSFPSSSSTPTFRFYFSILISTQHQIILVSCTSFFVYLFFCFVHHSLFIYILHLLNRAKNILHFSTMISLFFS